MIAQPENNVGGSAPPRQFDSSTVDPVDKPLERWLIAAIEEYKSLRVEIVDAIDAQRKIMQLGVTGLSVLIGLGLQPIKPLLTIALLTLLVPTLAIFITAGALGERFRASRASYFLAYRETIINSMLADPGPALEWETWLRRRPVFILRDKAEFFAVFTLTTGSLGLGFYTLFTTSTLHAVRPVFVPLSLALWLTSIILYFYLMEKARREFFSGG